MFDTDGNEMVDKKEFLVVGTWYTAYCSLIRYVFVLLGLLLQGDLAPESNKQVYASSNVYLMET